MQLTRAEAQAILSLIDSDKPAHWMTTDGAMAYAQVRKAAEEAEMTRISFRMFGAESYVPAIKLLRTITGMGLKEAKDIIEAINPNRELGVFGPVVTVTTARAKALALQSTAFVREGVEMVFQDVD